MGSLRCQSARAYSSRSLSNFLDFYGEPFLLNTLDSLAKGHYDEVSLLTDGTATGSEFISHLSQLSPNYTVDVVLDLHSDSAGARFSDRYYRINEITDAISSKKIQIRMLYQTSCFGSKMIPQWRKAGVGCINGSFGFNSFTFYSPQIFLEAWVNGRSFGASVDSAFRKESDILERYKVEYPMIKSLYGEDVPVQSRQIVSGDSASVFF